MSLDIGEAFSEGVSRTFERNGLLLAVVFIGIGFLTLVLTHTLVLGIAEGFLEFVQSVSPADLDVTQAEYDEIRSSAEQGVREARDFAPFALGLPVSVAAGGLLATALLAEAVSIVAVRIFATDGTDEVHRDDLTDNILRATLNGFIGGVVVWGLILVGLVLFVLPGLFFAVVFLFLRQEIALKNKNFVQAMADSWRLTRGNRLTVFALGLLVVLVSLLQPSTSGLVGFASSTDSELLSVAVGGVLTAFGAAVITRGYVRLDAGTVEGDDSDDDPEEAPYDAALGPDEIPE
jgi:hypothetical protein